jgi:putative heme iron utilization protein
LISDSAEHTRNLTRDPRASVLVAESGASDPLANGRVTLLGRCTRVDEASRPSVREAYLQTHPGAAYYVDFKDFGFWRLSVEAIRYIGGYGRMSWVGPDEWRAATVDPIASSAAAIIKHMNEDHADSMVTLCRALSQATDTSQALMTGIDRYGFEMSATTAQGPRPIRLAFDEPIADAKGARIALVALVKSARTATA